jgi:hypothetical protein
LGVLEVHAARVHALFTDIRMPGVVSPFLAHQTVAEIALLITSALPAEADCYSGVLNRISISASLAVGNRRHQAKQPVGEPAADIEVFLGADG